METLKNKRVGFAITASYCTFSKIIKPLKDIVEAGAVVTPIMSYNASRIDSRFISANEFKKQILDITGNDILDTIPAVEPIGPKSLLDIVIVAPCTGNTIAKLACGITDTPVTMACKSHLRNEKPVLIAVSTNDGLSANAANIGSLLNTKGYYFVPFKQDDPQNKARSLVANMNQLLPATVACINGIQLQPIIT